MQPTLVGSPTAPEGIFVEDGGVGDSDGLLEDHTHVFIVRVWDERRGAAGKPPVLRGVIEHLPSGRRRHFTDLPAIVRFVAAYLPPTSLRDRALRRLRGWWPAS